MINPHVAPSIHPELKAHTNLFKKKIYKIGENVYSAVGWAPANTIMIEGEDGVVLVDVGREIESASEVKREFGKITQKPIKAIILTHFHPDHIHGMKAWLSEADVKDNNIDIYAHERLLDSLAGQSVQLGPILSMRTRYTFGAFLSPEDRKDMNIALGPLTKVGTFTFISPTITMKDRLDITVSGIRMQLIHVPSEAPDEIIIYLPDSRILLSAEVIQGPTFPNLYPLRGSKFRDPVLWFKSIDVMRSLKADHMVPGHGQPVFGESDVEEVLRMYRDGIQYLHDQTLRYMNRGLTPNELAQKVAFPPHLENYKPYLRQYYGTIKHCVRDIYYGYLGWFQGDPLTLDPIPEKEQSTRLVELMGGRDTVLQEAEKVYNEGDLQWAAELATHLIRIDHSDMAARNIKAASFRNLGYAQMNINWRNWYLTSAMELDGSLDMESAHKLPGQKFASPDVVKALPAGVTIEAMTIRLIAEQTLDVHLTMGFQIIDTDEEYAIEIRRSVAQFHECLPEKVDVKLEMKRSFLNENILDITSVKNEVDSGDIKVVGEWKDVERFFGCFELEPFPIWLTIR